MKKNKRNGIKRILAAAAFCLVMSIGMICFADEQGTVTVQSAKIRASADASSEQLGSVAQGGTVDIIGETTGTDGKVWYQVYVDANTKGYIRSDLIQKNGSSTTSTSNTTSTDQTTTTATAIEAKKGTVVTNNVRIRKGASTNHDVVATANRGMVVTVTGEANGTDGKKWYQVSFTYNNKEITGFIRSDLVTFDNVPADTAVSEITGEENPEEQPMTEEVPEETQTQEEPEQTNQSSNNANEYIPIEATDIPYILPGFVPLTIKNGDAQTQGYQNGSFYIFFAQSPSGEQGWYLFDSENGIYQRYVYAASGVTAPANSGSVGIVPVIILVIIVIILAVVVGILVLKLREYTAYEDEEDEEYPEEDDLEELEDLEEEEEEFQPVRRPQGQASGGQPVRRPQPQGGAAPQQAARPQQRPVNGQGTPQTRRPQGQASGGQPVRRPQPQGGTASQGTARPQQRPVNGQGTPQTRRPQGQASGGQQAKRPMPQNEKPQLQKGYKAKKLMENDDDDMDFMDI